MRNFARPLIDAGFIISLFYIVSEHSSEDLAIPVFFAATLLWTRGWSLRGQIQSRRDLSIMSALLICWAGIQSGALNDFIASINERHEASAPVSDYQPMFDSRFEDAAQEVSQQRASDVLLDKISRERAEGLPPERKNEYVDLLDKWQEEDQKQRLDLPR